MKKIILTVTNDLNYDQRMIRIATSLSKANYEVLLVGRRRKSSQPLIEQPFEQRRIPCWFDGGKLFYLEYNIRLFFFLLFSSFDGVCSIDLDTLLAGYYTSKLRRKICIYDAHEYFTEVPEVVERPKVKAVWEWVATQTIPNLTYCYTVCESLQKVFKQKYGTSFEVIRNVPFQQKEVDFLRLDSNEKVILHYQGALNDGRGLEEMIHAMVEINKAIFWIAGEGDLSNELRTLAKDLGVTDKVKFWGYLPPHELKEVTQKAHIGINLLQNKGLNYYYSLANKFFDYIQVGKPSLNMNFPEYATIMEEYKVGLLLEDLAIPTFIHAIKALVENPNRYYTLQEECKKAAVDFVWEKEEKKLIAFYEKIPF